MRCATHPEVLAVDTCSRCGGFVCEACLVLVEETPYCTGCFARRDISGRASARATIALLLSVFGMFCLPPLSVLALVLVFLERRAIAAGRSPRTSLAEIRVAKLLAWVGISLALLVIAGSIGVALLRELAPA